MVLEYSASESTTTWGTIWQYQVNLENVHSQQSRTLTFDMYFQGTFIHVQGVCMIITYFVVLKILEIAHMFFIGK